MRIATILVMAGPAETTWGEFARGELRRSGARAGAARDAVVEFLAAQDCCVTAQELFDGLRSAGRSVGIASVYRALDQLAELGLVHRVELGEGLTRFEPAHPGGEHHHHLVCGTCGKVDTFDDPELERAIREVAGSHDYSLGQHDVVLRGSCQACRA
jgi:Fur family ferric uptake transcriptional regulator